MEKNAVEIMTSVLSAYIAGLQYFLSLISPVVQGPSK